MLPPGPSNEITASAGQRDIMAILIPGKHGDEDTLQRWSSLIGIITAIVGNMLIALALNVQRYAHTRLHKERARIRYKARAAVKRSETFNNLGRYGSIRDTENGDRRPDTSENGVDASSERLNYRSSNSHDALLSPTQSTAANGDDLPAESSGSSSYLKSPYWWLGQVLITLGEMGNFLAYGFAPASIVSPLGVVALISNCIIAPVMFKERFRFRDFWGVVIAVLGVVTVVSSAKQEETKLNPHDIITAITTLEFKIYFSVTITLIGVLMWVSTKYGRRTILIDLGLVGLFGGYTVLATKGISSMLSSTLWRAFTSPITYVLIVILLGTAIMQIRYVNKALQRFDSTQVIPIQFVMFTLCVILGSAILYRDFEKTTPKQAETFVGGCLLTFFGVFLITSGRHQKEEEDVLSDAEGIEETIGLMNHEGNPTQVDDDMSISQSRRSSKISRVSFAGVNRDTSDSQTIRNSSLGTSPVSTSDDPIASLSSQAQYRLDGRNPSLDSSAGISIDTSTAVPPLTNFTPDLEPAYGTDRPITPRTNVGTLKNNSRSQTFISPSPLSSTVTRVVKDAFLRENEASLATQSSLRRIRSSIRASLYFNNEDDSQYLDENETTDTQQTLVAASDSHLPAHFDEHEQSRIDDTTRTRSRSLSATLGDLFRPRKKPIPTTYEVDQEQGERSSP